MIPDDDIPRLTVRLRTPFRVESLPLLARLHRAAFRVRGRMSKRFVGKPAKRLYRLLVGLGCGGTGRLSVDTPAGPRAATFDARNTQFGALYLPQNLPVYEPETSALLDRLVGDDDRFVDVGANWGWYAALIATRPGFRGGVDAFEPFPTTFADLARLVRQAGLEDRVACHEIALADRAGEADMGFSDGVQSGLARLGEGGGARVRLARLDDLGLPSPAVIKIDAEDHELEVLAGATAVIDAARPFILYENWLHPERPRLTLDPTALLAARGYRFFAPAWCRGDPDCILPARGDSTRLALLPFPPAHRFMMPAQVNILAVPVERMDDLRRRLG